MRRILITFLGRTSRQKGFYETTDYEFGPGAHIRGTFMAHALLAHLRANNKAPTCLVVLGTSGSMWDALVEQLSTDDVLADERLRLMDDVAKEEVTQPHLDAIRPLFDRALALGCRPILITRARTMQQQIELLEALRAAVGPLGNEDEIIVDVTHGFRHLPMLVLLIAMYFEVAYGCKVREIYYGALDMKAARDKPAPVIRLDGLLLIGRWIRALYAYDKDADPSPFIALLKTEGAISQDAARSLWRLAHFERTGQTARARGEAKRFLAEAAQKAWSGASALFKGRLVERLQATQLQLYERQRQLALLHLDHGDFLRAAIFGQEAIITRLTEDSGRNPADHRDRDAAKIDYEEAHDKDRAEFAAYCDLRALRNALAHAGDPKRYSAADRRATAALGDPDATGNFLRERFDILLGAERDH